jgi:hypothetical protein
MQNLVVSGDRIFMPIPPDTQDFLHLGLMYGNLRAKPTRTNISSPPSPHIHESASGSDISKSGPLVFGYQIVHKSQYPDAPQFLVHRILPNGQLHNFDALATTIKRP